MMNPTATVAPSCFPKTQWTEVIGAMQSGNGSVAWLALTDFCQQYRPAICGFFRRRGCSPEQAEDLTQDFFASRILEQWKDRNGFLHALRRDQCDRFRSFLSHVLWRFLQDKWKADKAVRAGGGATYIPLESLETGTNITGCETLEDFGREFDRVFALEIIRNAAQRSKHSKYLEAHLRREISQQQAAVELGISENAFKQSYCRFRERLAFDLWDEVAKLAGPDEAEIRAEIRYLMSLFAESPA
jgi:DNA-directed RNA polymerase specialized sigma24 family protein